MQFVLASGQECNHCLEVTHQFLQLGLKQTLHSLEYHQWFGAKCGQQGEPKQFLPLCLQGPESRVTSSAQHGFICILPARQSRTLSTTCPKIAVRKLKSENEYVQPLGKCPDCLFCGGQCRHVSGPRTIETRVRGATSILFLVAHVFLHAILPSLYAASKFVLMPLSACHSAPNCIFCPIHARLKASSSAREANRIHVIDP